MTVDDITAAFNISRSTLRRWRVDGSFPAGVKIGPRRVVWSSVTVWEWFAARARKAA